MSFAENEFSYWHMDCSFATLRSLFQKTPNNLRSTSTSDEKCRVLLETTVFPHSCPLDSKKALLRTQKEKLTSVFSAGHTECKFYYSVDPISPYVGNSFAQTSLPMKKISLSQKIFFWNASLGASNALLTTPLQNFCHKGENFSFKFRN